MSHPEPATKPHRETVRTLWIGEELPAIAECCLNSFAANGHPVEVYSYTPLKTSSQLKICDANNIIPESGIFYYPNGSPAAFSNYFRYLLLQKLGAWWVDTDVFCLKPLPDDTPLSFGKQDQTTINTAVLKIRPDHPILSQLISICENPNQFLPWDTPKKRWKKLRRRFLHGNKRGNLKWGETGPSLLTRLTAENQLSEYALPENSYYPIAPLAWKKLFTAPADTLGIPSHTLTVHLWNEFSKNFPLANLHPDSFVSRILRDHRSLDAT